MVCSLLEWKFATLHGKWKFFHVGLLHVSIADSIPLNRLRPVMDFDFAFLDVESINLEEYVMDLIDSINLLG